MGDFIYAFDIEKKAKVFTKILRLHSYEDAPTLDIYTDGHYFCTATKDHKWVVEINNDLVLVTTKDLNRNENIFVDIGEPTLTEIEHSTGSTDEVWCPETDYGTWYTVINDKPCVTGNSAYANAYAAKIYKKKGGTWRKQSSKRKRKWLANQQLQIRFKISLIGLKKDIQILIKSKSFNFRIELFFLVVK